MSGITHHPSNLVLAVQPHRDRVIVRLVGELDLAVAGRVETALEDLADAGFDQIVVDLRELTFMDSAGVHMLVAATRRTEHAGCGVSMVRGPRRAHGVLELTAAESLLRFVPADAVDGRR
jgi:anti-sigma B factor antagonist